MTALVSTARGRSRTPLVLEWGCGVANAPLGPRQTAQAAASNAGRLDRRLVVLWRLSRFQLRHRSLPHTDTHPCTHIHTLRRVALTHFLLPSLQLGLCAFRCGRLVECQQCLVDVCSGGRQRELLAQAVITRGQDKTPEQEKLERRRLLPYHMHINLDLLDTCHLVASMLMEMPTLAANDYSLQRGVVSKYFRRQLEAYQRDVFMGPPENNKGKIMAASRELADGDWRACSEVLLSMRVWDLWSHCGVDRVRDMLQRRVKEEALRTYVLTFSTTYATMALGRLCSMFEVQPRQARALISKMIADNQLAAAWDDTDMLVLHKQPGTRLQSVALQLADKLTGFADANDRLQDARSGANKFRDGGKFGQRGNQGRRGGGGRRGRGPNPAVWRGLRTRVTGASKRHNATAASVLRAGASEDQQPAPKPVAAAVVAPRGAKPNAWGV